ncbi:bestrophin family protein [Allorhizobium sp. BGMRC 0089]|uniref:bestrophin family protein n=1 Tax=Allorhizobium sonneratiae TaxID=2934936 RepID=UPI002033674D|nr:bestrophin family protein [Allorhizobium sonneratiae]MCM2291879.1 bestrophin family protein [Allorhizobium sonneratiae]
MIVRDRPGPLLLFFILRGSIVPKILMRVLFVTGLSALVVAAHRYAPAYVPSFSGGPLALMGVTLSIFLGFRNNACYDRWWEGRKQWGQLLISARGLARQTALFDARNLAREKRELLLSIVDFAHALVSHLRPEDKHVAAFNTLNPEAIATSRNVPDLILRRAGSLLAGLRAKDALSDVELAMFDLRLEEMAAVQGACERIRSTPVPFAYTLLVHRTAVIFCLLLPFGFDDILGWLTPLASGLMAYTFFGLDALGDELEEPFGILPNDLPIGAIATSIEISLKEALGDTDLPETPQPYRNVLL